MKYYSGTGDSGKTDVYRRRVAKNDKRIKAIGDVDELNSFIGLAYSVAKDEGVKAVLKRLERDLYVINVELSGYSQALHDGKRPLGKADVDFLEEMLQRYSKEVPDLVKFIYPNGSVESAYLNVCRAVARRAERSVIDANVTDAVIKTYINRLSSLLFVLFRYTNKISGKREEMF